MPEPGSSGGHCDVLGLRWAGGRIQAEFKGPLVHAKPEIF